MTVDSVELPNHCNQPMAEVLTILFDVIMWLCDQKYDDFWLKVSDLTAY